MRGFIESFAKSTTIVSQVMEILKNRGLDKTSYKECYHLSTELLRNSKVKKRLQACLKQNLKIQKKSQRRLYRLAVILLNHCLAILSM
jgi:hypothetical protein